VREKAIKPGDHFRKSDAIYPSVWVVTRIIHTPGVPTHYILTDTEGRGEVRTISEPTLIDPDYYTPVVIKDESDPADLEGRRPADGGRKANARDRLRDRTERHSVVSDVRDWLRGLGVVSGQAAGSGGGSPH